MARDSATGAAAVVGMPVEVVRSSRRHKTSAARVVDGIIEVRIPAWLSAAEEADIVADLVARVQRASALVTGGTDLVARAAALADRYGLPEPLEIRWSTAQRQRWGSCTPDRRTIRISSRLRNVPAYVLDAVIVHELAHLVEPGHGAAFAALVDRYPRNERADGFLEAMSLGCAVDEFVAH